MIVMMIMIKGSVVYMAGKGGYDGRRDGGRVRGMEGEKKGGRRECEGNKGVRDK